MGTIRELQGVTEDDTVDTFRYRTTWVVYGFTREELYDAITWPDPAPDIEAIRTGFLAKRALVESVPAYVGEAPLTSVATKETDELENYFTFELVYEAGVAARPAANEESQPESGGDDRAKPRPSIRVTTQSVVRQVANGPIRVYGKTGETAPAAPKGILPDGQGGFRGAEVAVPSLSWSENHVIAPANLSLAKALAITGKVNATSFRGFPAGTVLCLGGAADQRPDGWWDASIEFQYSAPIDDTAAPGFSDYDDVTKDGWEFLFPLTDSAGDVTALCVAPLYDAIEFASIVPSLG